MTVLDLDDPALDPPPARRSRLHFLLFAVVALLGLLLVAVGGLLLVQRGESLPGTRLAGLDAGGLGEREARQRVAVLVGARQGRVVQLSGPDLPQQVAASDLGLLFDAEGTVDQLLAAGRTDGLLDRVRTEVGARFGGRREVALVGSVDRAALDARIEQLRAQTDQELDEGGFAISVDGDTATATARLPRDGRRLDVPATRTLLERVLPGENAGPFELPVDVTPARSTAVQVQTATAKAQAVLDQTLRLTTGDVTLALPPAQLATLIESRPDASGVMALSVRTDAVTALVSEAAKGIDIAMVPARFDSPAPGVLLTEKQDAAYAPQPVGGAVQPGRDGRALDVPAVVAEFTTAVQQNRTTGPLAIAVVPPPVAAQDLARVDQVIGSFTTAYACCAPRARNIARMAEIVDGVVVAPGADFSLNAAAGPRTLERGFLVDGAILDGELVEQIGGGVSQFSTTLFNAVWFAGLPVLDHTPHSSYISRYPPGREATLDFDSIDQVWRNDTGVPVVVRTAWTDTSVTVALYGHTGDRLVSSDTGPPAPRAGGGFRVQVDRTVSDAGRVVGSDDVSWTYAPPLD